MKSRNWLVGLLVVSVAHGVLGAGVWTGAGGDARWSNPLNWQDGEVPCTNVFASVDLGALSPGGAIEVDVPVQLIGPLVLSGQPGDVWTLAAGTGGTLRFSGGDLNVEGGRLDIAVPFRAGSGTGTINKYGTGEVRFLNTTDYGTDSRLVNLYAGRLVCAASGGIRTFRPVYFGGALSLECNTALAGLSTDVNDQPTPRLPVFLNGYDLWLYGCNRKRTFGAEVNGTNSWLTVDRGADVRLDVSPKGLAGVTLNNADLALGAPKGVCLDFEDPTTPSRDVTGRDLGLIAVGSPRVVHDSERGNVLELDGNSYLKGPEANLWLSSMPKGREPFTAALWLKFAPGVATKAAIFSWGNASLDQFAGLRVDSGNDVCYAWYGDNFYFSRKTLNDGAWHHVAISYDGDKTMYFYFDDRYIGNDTNRVENIPSKNLVIGNGMWSNVIGGSPAMGGFKGWIDDFTVVRAGGSYSATIGALREKGAAVMDVQLPESASVVAADGGTLTLDGDARVATIAGNGLLGGIALRDDARLTVAGAGTATSTVFNAQIRGNAAFVKDGADYELVLGGANAYTGATTVAAGTLTLKTPVAQDGLVAYWDFEDPADFGRDRSMSGFDLKTVNGAGLSAVADGVLGGAARFDGAKSACVLQDTIPPAGFPKGNNPFTASVWVRPASSSCTGNRPVFEWGQAGQNNACVMLRFDGASTLCFIKTGGADLRDIPFTGGRFDDGAWHHIVVWSDGAVQACWIDGVKAKSAALSSPLLIGGETGVMKIGKKLAGGEGYYTGDIDELRVYNRALSDAEIRDEYALRRPAGVDPVDALPQPIAHWAFDDPENLGKDSGPYGYDLVANGSCTTTADDLTYGRALDLRSNVMYLSQPPGADFPAHFPTGNAPFTVSCRVCPSPLCRVNGGAFFWGDSNMGQGHYFILAPDQGVVPCPYKGDFGGGTGMTQTRQWCTEASDRVRWMHLVAVYSPADTGRTSRRCRLYVNGELCAAVSRDAPLNIPGANLFVGRKLSSTETFQGLLDDVQVFDRALSHGQVRALARAFEGTPSPLPPGSPVSVASGARLKVASAAAACGALSGTGEVCLESESRLTVNGDSEFAGTVVGRGTLCADACAVALQGDVADFLGTFESRNGGRIVGGHAAAALAGGSHIEISAPAVQLPLLDVTGEGRVGRNVELVWDSATAGSFVLVRAAGGFGRTDVEEALATWTCTSANGKLRVVPCLDGTGTVLSVNVLKKGTIVVVR